MRRSDRVACDTGPLVALSEPADQFHDACARAAADLPVPLLTIWPVVSEALYLLRGSAGALRLLAEIESGTIRVSGPTTEDVPRIRELMGRYADLPADFVDLALFAFCERENIRTVFTVDRRDFEIYRPRHVRRLKLVP